MCSEGRLIRSYNIMKLSTKYLSTVQFQFSALCFYNKDFQSESKMTHSKQKYSFNCPILLNYYLCVVCFSDTVNRYLDTKFPGCQAREIYLQLIGIGISYCSLTKIILYAITSIHSYILVYLCACNGCSIPGFIRNSTPPG